METERKIEIGEGGRDDVEVRANEGMNEGKRERENNRRK